MATYSEEQWETMIAKQEETMEPTLNWLRETLLLDDTVVNELIDRFPRILILNISGHLEPSFFYTEYIGIQGARRVVANHPQVLGASLENQLQPLL